MIPYTLKYVHPAIHFLQVAKKSWTLRGEWINSVKNTLVKYLLLQHALLNYVTEITFMAKKSRWLHIGLLLTLAVYSYTYADCPLLTYGTLETVARVVDGDTLHLTNGTKVRLAGINTPEISRGSQPDEPNAMNAKDLLERILTLHGNEIRLESTKKPQDHYGRLVAHTYTKNGLNIQEEILRKGLAFGYAHPPNLEHLECYRAAETLARQQKLGLWNSSPLNANETINKTKGFARVTGKVQNINRTKKEIWIDLGTNLSLRIAKEDFTWFKNFDFSKLSGKNLEVRGYLHTHEEKLQMRLRHPAYIYIN